MSGTEFCSANTGECAVKFLTAFNLENIFHVVSLVLLFFVVVSFFGGEGGGSIGK